ncbi:PP2C family protein-serine/threonine phosphatase [Actinoallomurus bryophytorum]|uniref:Stage II sporulation protein E n=1 Tax=Actinoallomurus bryophytorum TaxID=1490222 RepID=A0A543CDU2_9ACTN|nr:PP2C family protein-serine/threonine phosphatase [Actinoallomurus bryophytorum]TQL95239.1 stage II sporulation protein E [Actinoallomurus bryophytorum]
MYPGFTHPADTGDPVIGQMLSTLLLRSHLMAPGTLADHLAEAARPLGVSEARIYLADLQQHRLRPMPDGSGSGAEPLDIESTTAGRAFQTVTIQSAEIEHVAGQDGPFRLWVPLLEGVERLGVLELCFTRDGGEASTRLLDDVSGKISAATLERCRILASLTGLLIASKGTYSDIYTEIQRSRAMALQAEMVWAFMAPRTFATSRVQLACALEPAYEVGGDAFDHSLIGDRFHVSLFDSVGHDLTAGLISSVAMASCRTTRRTGGGLTDIAVRADEAIANEFGASRFATALLCDLDIASGEFAWLPCGHPPPLLIRGDKVEELTRPPCLPLGLAEIDADLAARGGTIGGGTIGGGSSGDGYSGAPVAGYTEQLQAGDRLLLYTDGVIEGRDDDGRQFSTARLSDFVIRRSAEGMAAPEILRSLNRAVLDHQRGRLSDDATVILVEWMPKRSGDRLTLQTMRT